MQCCTSHLIYFKSVRKFFIEGISQKLQKTKKDNNFNFKYLDNSDFFCKVTTFPYHHFFLLQVPELAGFWILTLVLQLPLTLMLLLNESMLIMPMERAVNIIMALFVLFETVQGYRVIKTMIDHQVSKFHVQQFDDLIELQEMPGGVEDVGFRPQ